MKTEFHAANERGYENPGWLESYHNFSFAEYFNPLREHFGTLRVLNDSSIQAGKGFAEHPHNNMEIISIPLSACLEQRDNLGNFDVISPGEVQVISAGTGIRHTEYNHSEGEACNFLQIWIYPRNRGISPASEKKAFDPEKRVNALQMLVTPDTAQEEGTIPIAQDAWISVTSQIAGNSMEYTMHSADNGVFVFQIEGASEVAGRKLEKRDAVAITETLAFEIRSLGDAEILITEVPMK